MKKETTKEQIVAGAKVLFHRFGFEKTSMEDIANHVHKAKRSLYNHFGNKEELFVAAVTDEMEEIQRKLQTIIADDSQTVLERLRNYLLQRTELMSKATMFHLMLKKTFARTADQRFEEAHASLSAFGKWEHDIFVKVWEAKPCVEGTVPDKADAEAFADMLQMALHGLNYSFFVQDNYEQYKNNYTFLINLIINSVRNNFIQNPKELLS